MTVKITYYGHSTFGMDADGTKLIIDPFLSPDNTSTSVTEDDVEADFILLTHGHFDHVNNTLAIAKRTGATVIANFEIVSWYEGQGVENVHPLHIGGGNTFPFGRVKMTIAHHGSTLPDGSPGGNPGGFLINFNDGVDVYVAGDTALTYDMKLIGEAGGVDLAILPIGDNFTMGPDDAITAAHFVQAKKVVPCHYNTWPYIEQDAQAFADKLYDSIEIDCTVMSAGDELVV